MKGSPNGFKLDHAARFKAIIEQVHSGCSALDSSLQGMGPANQAIDLRSQIGNSPSQ
jgi:hypothetical protein